MKRTVISVVILLMGIIFVGLWFSGTPKVKFGIYLQRNNELVIDDEDITWYNASDHRFKLTLKGAEKISSLQVGVYGEPFTIKIGRTVIYEGAFWTPISSIGYHGIIIEKPIERTDMIQLQWGYPPSYRDADPRDDSRIVSFFQKIGKLVN